MKKSIILLWGQSVIFDKQLIKELSKFSEVLLCSEIQPIEMFERIGNACLVLFEMAKEKKADVATLKSLLQIFPNIPFILIDGNSDRDVLIQAFENGIKDAFKKPYKRELVVERVKGVLKHN